jgi:hypothetical protein
VTLAVCTYCKRPVDPRAQTTYRRVLGWERKALARSRRGGSDITLRESRDEFACPTCVDRLQQGLGIGQESLL